MSKNFCVVPWVHIASKPIGTARICCLMSNATEHDQGILRDDNGEPYNLGTADFDEVKNAKLARELRLSMLKDERHPLCDTCYVKEDMGAGSRRTVTNRMYEGEFGVNEAREATDEEGYTSVQPSYWDFRFGNLCNIKCIMCHPASSNQWYEDYIAINNTTKFGDGGIKVALKNNGKRWVDNGEYDWWDNEDFWKRLEEKIPYLKQVYLVGGEPMLIQPHYDFLQKVIDSGRAGEVTLEYDTNLTHIHQRALDLWKPFKRVKLRVSVDDFNKQFDYVRFPSKWDKVSQNIERLYSEINIKIDFTVTWQVTTAFTTPHLLHYLSKFEGCDASVRILSTPKYFDVAILPKSVKESLLEIYRDLELSGCKFNVSHLVKYLETNLEKENREQLNICVQTLNKLDKLRNTDWKETFCLLHLSIQDYINE